MFKLCAIISITALTTGTIVGLITYLVLSWAIGGGQ